ncbi:hypothetical protein [Clostridium minihomine]|uniref:hypothetical protein n=1 Tax=Clostridium minihomine TaxID=2045012 RepID=UPI000C783DC4|nr:hypothetical protein [Clostridium minihomine]
MTKKQLSQLRDLKREIQLLKEQSAEIRNRMRGMKTPNCIEASAPYPPYQKHNVTIYGVAPSETDAYQEDNLRLQKKRLAIAERERRCQTELDKIERFISGIEDSKIRQIITLYYIQGLSWQQVAFKIGHHDEQYARRKIDRFLKCTKCTDYPM